LPKSKSNTVLGIPKYKKNEKDEYDNSYFELDAYIIIADNITGKILYKYYEPKDDQQSIENKNLKTL